MAKLPSPHRLKCVRETAEPIRVGELHKGDYFMREGTPHLVVEGVITHTSAERGVWVCNAHSGSVWCLDSETRVWPAYNVELKMRIAGDGR